MLFSYSVHGVALNEMIRFAVPLFHELCKRCPFRMPFAANFQGGTGVREEYENRLNSKRCRRFAKLGRKKSV